MAGPSDLGNNAAMQAQINQLLAERNKLLDEQETILSKQQKLYAAIMSAFSSKEAEKAARDIDKIKTSQEEAEKAAQKSTNSQKDFTAAIKQSADSSSELSERLGTVASVAGSLGDALSGAASGTFGLMKAGGSLIGTLFNVGQAILSIPFKLWDSFVEKSMNVPYNPAFQQALEDTRKSFGDLGSGAGKQVLDTYEKLRASTDKYGLSLRRIFGAGVDGMAATLKFVGEMSGALGSQMGPILEQVGSEVREVMLSMKGLGLSAEENGAAMKFFYNSGQNASKMMQEMGTTAAMMAKQTGFNIKTLGKAMVETIQVFPQFAKGGVQAMAKVAHYTHNLGIEVKDLQSVFDKFDSFDQAAESASQLSQAFGVNIDAMKMVKEQDPTKRLEALRNAFKAAGKDINSMTSAERKLAESTVGLSGAAFEAALGEGNKKKALSESEKAAKAATQAAKDQTNAMRQLAKSIERVIPPQGEKFKGFFDAFSKGFSEGAYRSENLRNMMVNLQATFRQAYYFGREFAKLLFDKFPGMTDLAKGFTKIFNPVTFRKFFDETLGYFRTFFAALEKDPRKAFDNLVNSIQETLGKYFGGTGTNSALGMIESGFKKIISVLGVIGGKAVELLMQKMTEGIKSFTKFLSDPNKITDTAGTAKGFVQTLFGPIVDAIKENWTVLKIALVGPAGGWPPGGLLGALWNNIKEPLTTFGSYLAMYFIGKFALSFTLDIGAALLKDAIVKYLKKRFVEAAASKAVAGAAGDVANAAVSAATSATSSAAGAAQGAAGQAATGFFAKYIPTFTRFATGALPLLKAAVTKIPVIGTIIAGIAGIWSAYKFGDSPEDKELQKVGMGKWDAFTSSFLKVATFGLLDLRGKLEEQIKQTKELVKKTNEDQAKAFREGAEEARSNAEGLMQKAIESGNKEDALSYMAQVELQNAIAKGDIDASKMTGDQYIEAMKKFKTDAKERLKPVLEQKMKEALDKAQNTKLEKEQAEKLAKIESARTLVEQVKDVGELNKQLSDALAGLDSAIAKGAFQEKIKRFQESVKQIYPMIESVAKQIATAREKAAISMSDKADPIAMLGESLKGAASLADGLIKLKDIPEGTANKLAGLVTGMSNALSGTDLTKLSAVGLDIEAFAEKIADADGKLREAMKPGEGLVKVIKDVGKLGELNVTHNIPGVQMTVTVKLDAKELAKSLINVDVSNDTRVEKRPTVGPRPVDKTVG